MPDSIEYRATSLGFRAFDQDGGEQGIFEGYAAVWDNTDDHHSRFLRGAFTKTLRETGDRIKLLWNHTKEVIGVPLELREDDVGLFIKGRLILETQRAKETYALMKAGAIDTLSFGFRTIKDHYDKDQVRNISEVRLFEISPVVFASNENASILDVRSIDFAKTVEEQELKGGNFRLRAALDNTIDDIWFNAISDNMDPTPDAILGLLDNAIDSFRIAYLEWAGKFIEMAAADDQRSSAIPAKNELAEAMINHCINQHVNPEQLAMNSSLTVPEARALCQGNVIAAPDKLSGLPDEIIEAHKAIRLQMTETLFNELRDKLTSAELTRIRSLLDAGINSEQETSVDVDWNGNLTRVKQFRQSLALLEK